MGSDAAKGLAAGLLRWKYAVDDDWLDDILHRMFSKAFVAERHLVPDLLVDAFGEADATGRGQSLQPGCNVYAVAEKVAVLEHDVAKVDPDSEEHGPGLEHFGIASPYLFLNAHGTEHGLHGTRELSQFDDFQVMLG